MKSTIAYPNGCIHVNLHAKEFCTRFTVVQNWDDIKVFELVSVHCYNNKLHTTDVLNYHAALSTGDNSSPHLPFYFCRSVRYKV